MLNKQIIVPLESNRQRLDIFLSDKLNMSRSQVQKTIKQGLVLINNKQTKKVSQKLAKGDKIKIKSKITKNVPKIKLARKKTKKTWTIKIIYEDPDYLIVNKPSGLLTHPTIANKSQALSKLLLKKYPKLKKVGEDPVRPGIVHRLDKDASGLLVVAKNQVMFEHLKKQFKNRQVDKEYAVLVHGQIEADSGKIDFPITRSKNSQRMAAIPTTKKGIITNNGKIALTEFWIAKKYLNFTLLRVKIHTGRMHQIRAHMLAYNHPVVGDPLYYQKKQTRKYDKKLSRMFLHCVKIGFTDLQKNKQEFKLNLPKKLANFLKMIK